MTRRPPTGGLFFFIEKLRARCRFPGRSFVVHDLEEPRMTKTTWNYGWVVVGAGALMTWMAMGALLSLPVFLAPIAADTGWSRGGIGFAMTLNFLTMGIGSFFWGRLSDRHG